MFSAGVAAADPRAVTRQAVMQLAPLHRPVWIVAVGKGANAMASGAVEALRDRRVSIVGGLVVASADDPSSTHGLDTMVGDHPTPGPGSFAAADRLSDLAARTTADSDALVLVSGGATSLIAAPVAPITHDQLIESFAVLLRSGADINLMNAARKRLLRFGAGRLALALGTRNIHCLIASDVVGNDLASIASGPCVPDHGTANETRDRLQAAGAWDALPLGTRNALDAMADDAAPDTPPANHPRFASTFAKVILDRTHAERGAAKSARQFGARVEVMTEPMSGEASTAAKQLVTSLLGRPRKGFDCVIWSGETTVTLGSGAGRGGRCQEFALASAIRLESDNARSLTILAAGTDGRDGPTDAAGAIVDASTCERIRARGINPGEALQAHSSYDALDAAGAVLKTGPTGTNVNDLAIALFS